MTTPTFDRSAGGNWVLVDLAGKTLGRVATEIAYKLRGKHRPTFTPNADTGDFVVAVNAAKIKLTGKKLTDKIYYRHSGYMGGLKQRTAQEQLDRDPTKLMMSAVKGMLPKTTLGRSLLTKLKVYAGEKHPHASQFKKA